MTLATNPVAEAGHTRPAFDEARFAQFADAYRTALRAAVAIDADYPERMRNDPAYCDLVADRMTCAIRQGRTCGTVCYLQSDAFRAASRALRVPFTIKAMDAWLRA